MVVEAGSTEGNWIKPPEDRQLPPEIPEREYQDNEMVVSSEDIQRRVTEIAGEIAADYKGKKLTLLAPLKGSVYFATDLLSALHTLGVDAKIELPPASTYGKNLQAGETKIGEIDGDLVNGRDVIIIDDILDSGETINTLVSDLRTKFKPNSLKTAFIVDKADGRKTQFHGDYVGFTVRGLPWLEGYGMDSFGYGRGNPNIIARIDPKDPDLEQLIYEVAIVV